MSQKTVLWGFMMTLAVGSLTSCHDSLMGGSDSGTGGLNPIVELNTSVNSAKKSSKSRATEVTANDLSLTIAKTDGTYSHTWAALSDYDSSTEFEAGDYTVSAAYGSIENEGFNRPAYAGSTNVTVVEGKTTPVSLTATLINTMVSVEYTDEFRNYMAAYSAELHSTGGAYLYYGPDETEPIYIRPGNVTLDVDVTKPNGTSATLRVATIDAKPRYHYHITVGLEYRTGEAFLTITFDENLVNEDVIIDLSDELMNAPAPEIKGDGVANGGNVTYMEGSTPATAALNIVARGEIQSAVLTTASRTLIAQGWPTEIELVGMAENMKSRLSQLGLTTRSLGGEATKFGVVDFTNVPTHFREVDGTDASNFELRVVDRYGKVSEPFAFSMNMVALQIALSNPSALAMAATNLDVDLTYNGNDVAKNVAFQYKNARGTWEPLTVRSIGEPTGETYRVALTVPSTMKAVVIRATANGKYSQELTVNRAGAPEFSISAPEADIWTTTAKIVIASTEASPAVLATGATIYISTDGVNYTPATVSATDGATLTITGLTAGTAYYAKASVTENEAQCCETIRFATEAKLDVPNGNFEAITQKYSESKIYQSGEWSISAGINYQSYAAYAISEANGWATTNAKTMSGATRNTWFVQPSVFNTSLTYSSTVPAIKVVNKGGGTDTPASFKGFSAHGGANAMVVRNVAWDANGSTPSRWYKALGYANESAWNQYYNHTVPNVANHSVGKMFLGSYSYNNGTETYNTGVAFASRPKTLTGWYTYTPDGNDSSDNGVVTVEVRNGSTVIATGTATLAATSSYKQFTINLTYAAGAPKATSVSIMVASSKHASTSQAAETSAVKVTEYLSRYEAYAHGATLVVDDFSFGY